jgi:hypothetical protein
MRHFLGVPDTDNAAPARFISHVHLDIVNNEVTNVRQLAYLILFIIVLTSFLCAQDRSSNGQGVGERRLVLVL